MAIRYVTDEQLTSIANAIRDKSGGTSLLSFPDEFIDEIDNIETDGTSVSYSEVTNTSGGKTVTITITNN